jgi:hypothetical protein
MSGKFNKKSSLQAGWLYIWGPVAGLTIAAIAVPVIGAILLLTAHPLICAGIAIGGLCAGYAAFKFFRHANKETVNLFMDADGQEMQQSRGLGRGLELQQEPSVNKIWKNELKTSRGKNIESTR